MSYALTIFTPTYNREKTLTRLYESLCRQSRGDFEWLVVDDGSTDGTRALVEGFIAEGRIPIRYIYKENGGLYTGYNTAYLNCDSTLAMCIDSDDYAPDNAVELVLDKWEKEGGDEYAGVIGLDFYHGSQSPIGGFFHADLKECYLLDLSIKKIHVGDTKQAMRTDLMKEVAPMVGFPGEKFFNPYYMLVQVCDNRPLLVVNDNLCFVDYNVGDNMSANMFRQYRQSPRSFAKQRVMEMGLKRTTWRNNLRSMIHLWAECRLAGDFAPIRAARRPWLAALAYAPGLALSALIALRSQRD